MGFLENRPQPHSVGFHPAKPLLHTGVIVIGHDRGIWLGFDRL